jgi:hypothetical protein
VNASSQYFNLKALITNGSFERKSKQQLILKRDLSIGGFIHI